ncbi:putative mitochondrial membrane protein Pet127 [Rosellinia necatrix]|uniref:Putative mitochondrial membrane protein Pet127 n=1 Tax=Rosellinia necatrix TaxID=77044 RepID=A0A1S8A679_ROSNE|nr:putative mitochondrial membrane protein Pet127 [Rosellinia necatrix]
MLRLGRRGVCRLTSSYVCASCLSAPHPASSISRRRGGVASHYARPLSTTAAWREATAPEPSAITTENNESIPGPPKPTKRRRKRPAKTASDGDPPSPKQPKEPKEPTDADAQRQLKVLQGALAALKNVLSTQGINTQGLDLGLPDAGLPAKPTPKAKSKAKKDKEKKSTAATTPDAEDNKARHTKRRQAKSSSAAKAASPKSKGKKRAVDPKTPPEFQVRYNGPRKPLNEATRKQASKSAARTPNLGIPYDVFAKPYEEEDPEPATSVPTLGTPPDKVHANELSLDPIGLPQPTVPSLSYGLDRVLFNRGVYQLQDPHSRVYNFDPYLSEIMPVNEFDFNALKEYVTSSKDNTLISIAKQHEKRYTGSTSSMTSMLAHFHFLLSNWRYVNVSMLSKGFQPESMQFTKIMRAPAAIFLHWKDGTYAIDADKEFDTANVLSMLGKSMEKLLTLPKDEYERYRHGNSDQITEEERNAEEAFHYTGFQDFMMRSQLDAHDSRVPGTGMFDLKTRAVVSIRMDAKHYHKGLGYEIRRQHGQWESFEREYFDMIRSAFLKYSLQVRMGRMDGIFVAFHNTERIFGFQYIPLSEMDLGLHGTEHTLLGDQEFKISLKLLNELLNRATKKWPERSLRVHIEARTSTVGTPFMYFFAKPTTPEEIAAVQNAGKASIEEFEKNILGLIKQAAEDNVESSPGADDTTGEDPEGPASLPAEETDSFAAWQEARQAVEEAMGDDELGVGPVKEAIGDALEQSGILHARSLAESHEYVNALLGALTGSTPSTRHGATAIDQHDGAIGDEDEVEEQVTRQEQEGSGQVLYSEADPATPSSPLNPGPETQESTEDLASTQSEQEVPSNLSGGNLQPHQPTEDVHETQPRDTRTISTEDSEGDLSAVGQETVDVTTTTARCSTESGGLEEESEENDSDEQLSEVELEDDVEVEKSSEDVGSSSLAPLKSLIMRMAQRIDETSLSDTGTDTPQDDASKLKEFERILKQLISQSRADEPKIVTAESTKDPVLDNAPPPNTESGEVTSPAAVEGEATPESPVAEKPSADEVTPEPELLALSLTIKNKVNNTYVERPDQLKSTDDWTVEYEIQEMVGGRAQKIYAQLKERRRKTFCDAGDKDIEWYKMFKGNLEIFTKKGRKFRESETRRAEGKPIHVMGNETPLRWEDVFWRKLKNMDTSNEGQNNNENKGE